MSLIQVNQELFYERIKKLRMESSYYPESTDPTTYYRCSKGALIGMRQATIGQDAKVVAHYFLSRPLAGVTA